MELRSDLVQEARREELDEFRKHQVYTKVPVQQCWDRGGKAPIGVCWVDIYKGDHKNPRYRSRWVAKEFKFGSNGELFAATPPLEAKKLLMSLAATEGVCWDRKNRWAPFQ